MLFMQRKWLRFSLSLLCLLSFIIAKLTLPFLAEVYDSAIVPLILFPVIDLFSEKKANKTTIAVVMVIFISVFFYRLCSISDAAREVRIKINLIERLIGNFRDTYGDKFLLRDENSFQLILPTLRYTEVSIEGLFYSSMASPDSAVLLITREDFEGYLSLPKIPLDSVGDVMNLSTVAYLLFEREYPKKYYKYFTGYRNLNPQYFSLDTSAIRWGNTDKRNDLAYLEQNIRIGIAEEDTLKTMPCRKKMISLLIENRGAVALYSGRENAHIRFRILDRTDSLRWDAGVMLLEADVYKQYKQVFFAGIPCETDTFRLEVDLVQDGCPLGIGDSALLISSWQISR
ncbi:MAG: hypothetical protein KatS3mg031_2344 [Chitinophagales bacterium]|nr:MAG: hypothetical protein KatS3mg031_2344 [Chitinophagales bacterium]